MLSLEFLGGAALEAEGRAVRGPAARRHPVCILALLALTPSRTLTRTRLVSLLWPDSSEKTARNRLNSCLYELRKWTGHDGLVSSGDDLRLEEGVVRCDVWRFEAAVEAGDFDGAVRCYGGEFLEGFNAPGSAEAARRISRARARLRRRYEQALERSTPRADVRATRAIGPSNKWETGLVVLGALLTVLLGGSTMLERSSPAGASAPVAEGHRAEPGEEARQAARELVLQARRSESGPATREGIDRLTRLYRRAVELDPTSAEARKGLTLSYVHRALTASEHREALADSAIAHGRSALALDPTLGEVHAYIGTVMEVADAPVAERLTEYRRALEIQPSSRLAWNELLALLGFQGRLAEKMRWLDRGHDRLVGSPRMVGQLAYLNSVLGRDSLARAWLARMPRGSLGSLKVEFQIGLFHHADPDRARAVLRRLPEDAPEPLLARRAAALALVERDWTEARRLYRALYPGIVGAAAPVYKGLLADRVGLAYALQRNGQREEANEVAREVAEQTRREIERGAGNYVPLHRMAAARLVLGDTARALEWLEKSVDAGFRDVRALRGTPTVAALRGHPRFEALLRRMERLLEHERQRVERDRSGLPPPPPSRVGPSR